MDQHSFVLPPLCRNGLFFNVALSIICAKQGCLLPHTCPSLPSQNHFCLKVLSMPPNHWEQIIDVHAGNIFLIYMWCLGSLRSYQVFGWEITDLSSWTTLWLCVNSIFSSSFFFFVFCFCEFVCNCCPEQRSVCHPGKELILLRFFC